MPDYSGTRATPRLDLGVALMEFLDQQSDFIGPQAFPVFKSNLKSAAYSAITRESLAQTGDTKRSQRGNYNRGSFGAKDKTFACVENGWEQPLSDDERKLYSRDFDAEFAATKIAEGVVLRNQEARIAAKVFDTAVFTGSSLYLDVSSSAPWTTVGSAIKSTITAGKAAMRANCGMLPNALILNYTNVERLKATTEIKDAIKYTSFPSDDMLFSALASYFGVKKVLVGNAIKNSAKEGATFSGADIWSNLYAALAIVPDNAEDLSLPALGRTFLWTEDCPENVFVEYYRDETIRSDVFRTRQHTDENLIDKYFGFLIKVAAS